MINNLQGGPKQVSHQHIFSSQVLCLPELIPALYGTVAASSMKELKRSRNRIASK